VRPNSILVVIVVMLALAVYGVVVTLPGVMRVGKQSESATAAKIQRLAQLEEVR
jgi:hypothetical protein